MKMNLHTFQLIYVKKGAAFHGTFNGGVSPGKLYTGFANEIVEFLELPKYRYDDRPINLTLDYFGGKEKIKLVPRDSVLRVLYNYWFYNIISHNMRDTANVLNLVKYGHASGLAEAIGMSKMLSSLEIDHTVCLVCSRNSFGFKNPMNITDMDALIKIKTDSSRTYWMAFNDIVTLFNEIPSQFQGEYAIAFKPGSKTESNENRFEKEMIPLTSAADNTITDSIQVNLDSASTEQLTVQQTFWEKGSIRHTDEIKGLLFEDLEAALASSVSKRPLLEMLKADNKEKMTRAFQAVFDRERDSLPAYFKSQINYRYGITPKALLKYKLLSTDQCRHEPAYGYQTISTMNDWIRTGNSQYSVRAGKFLGIHPDFTNKNSTRTMNIYLPYASTSVWDIRFQIPDGYQVKDIDHLNISVSNTSGSCMADVYVSSNTLSWHISEAFNNNFEPAANWPKLTEILNAIHHLSEQEIILEKKNP